jgi:hypothetical protein
LARYKAYVPPPPEPASAGFSASDLGVAFGQGAIGSTKALTDVAGATNIASQSLGDIQKDLSKRYSSERQAEMQRQAARMKAAEESGSTLAEIKAGALNVLESPLQSTAQAIGSFVPYLPAMFAAPVAATLGLGARSVAAITSVAQQAPKVMATAQGAGAVKGAIYDGVYEAEIEAGVSPEVAKKKAEGAQEYFGSNFDQIALGTGIGLLTGSTGIEKIITPAGRAGISKNIGQRVGTTAVAEAIPEGIQEGQERLAQNIALQREGYDVDTFAGVAGGATQGALMGALASGPIAAVLPPGAGPEAAPTIDPTAPPVPPEDVAAPPVDTTAPRAAPPSEAQDTQAMLDEFRGVPPAAVAEPAVAEPEVDTTLPPAAVAEPSVPQTEEERNRAIEISNSMAATGYVNNILEKAQQGFIRAGQEYEETGRSPTMPRVVDFLRGQLRPLMGSEKADRYIQYLTEEGGLTFIENAVNSEYFGDAVNGVSKIVKPISIGTKPPTPPAEPTAAAEPATETPTPDQPKMVEDETGEKLSYPMFVDMADKGYQLYSFENPRTYENKGGFGFGVYAPLGIDFQVGKKRDFWMPIHLYLELRPGVNVNQIAGLGTSFSAGNFSNIGLRFQIK